ncbi:transducin/WD-like repeat-protein [Trifolium medium]|uniref:Transducin/WD-like repeat-protein n=1 Tax=Trifolium medium TaxID=97028 RepID=A0A392NTL9_9FABA|nr:transducin/WD-like repeat-protein [Trifolium medium]
MKLIFCNCCLEYQSTDCAQSVYRVSDMELVRVLPSAEDEVNVACFHPFPGGGLVYGTKEGKLRILHYDGAHPVNGTGPSYFPEETFVGVSQ